MGVTIKNRRIIYWWTLEEGDYSPERLSSTWVSTEHSGESLILYKQQKVGKGRFLGKLLSVCCVLLILCKHKTRLGLRSNPESNHINTSITVRTRLPGNRRRGETVKLSMIFWNRQLPTTLNSFLYRLQKMSSNGEDTVDGTLEKKEEALVEAVKGVKINEEEETGKKTKAAEPGLWHRRECWELILAHPDKALLKSQFALFSKFGDKASDGETIKLSQSDKWFKQVKQIKDFMITMGGRNGKVQK